MNNEPRDNYEDLNEKLEQHVGLHEEVRIIYLVDSYEARYLLDTEEVIATAKGATPLAAMLELFRVKRKTHTRDGQRQYLKSPERI